MIDKNVPKNPAPVPSKRNMSAPPVPAGEPRETICPARAVRVMRTVGVLLQLLLIIVVPIGVILGRNTDRTNNTGATNNTGGTNIKLY